MCLYFQWGEEFLALASLELLQLRFLVHHLKVMQHDLGRRSIADKDAIGDLLIDRLWNFLTGNLEFLLDHVSPIYVEFRVELYLYC